MCLPDRIQMPPDTLDDLLDLILLDLAASHPRLSEDREAALKLRLFALVANGAHNCDPEELIRCYRAAIDAP
jgi:hypothetical protein